MDIDIKLLNKMLANQIQQYIKRVIQHHKVGFIPGIQVRFNIRKKISVIYYINRTKQRKHHMIILIAEKTFEKMQHHFRIKMLSKLGIEKIFFNMIKEINEKPTASIIPNGKSLKSF